MPAYQLYTLMNDLWLMDTKSLLVLEHLMQVQEQEKVETKPAEKMISFYSESKKQIYVERSSDIPKNSTAIINLVGPLTKYSGWFSAGADFIIAQLDFANNHPNVNNIILNIDGPGGSASAISLFTDFAQRKNKPIVALADQSTSLHYWIPNAIADHLMASNDFTAKFGSIGVVSSWMDVKKAYEKAGIKIHEVYPEESAHKNEIWRKIQEDEEKGIEMLKTEQLSPMAQKFQAAIKTYRPNIKEEEGVLTGRVFGAQKALELGMIDSIGNLQKALDLAQSLTEIQKVNP